MGFLRSWSVIFCNEVKTRGTAYMGWMEHLMEGRASVELEGVLSGE
jgi:hypothetical protein